MINVTKPAAKARLQRRLARLENTQRAKLAKDLRVILREQYEEAAQLVEQGYGHSMDVLLDQWVADYVKAFWAGFRRTGAVFSQLVFDALQQLKLAEPTGRKGIGDEFWNSFASLINLHTAGKVQRVSGNTKRFIKRIIDRGTSEGKSPKEIAKDLRASGEFNKARANRIARTEVHMASNFATQAAVKSTRLRMEKEWVAFLDERTRPEKYADPKWNHRAANGQRVPMDQDFTISGERMAYPGDPRGSAGNVINCRCVLMYHTIRQ